MCYISLWADKQLVMPESAFLIEIIKLWQGKPSWEEKEQNKTHTQAETHSESGNTAEFVD